MPRGTLQKFMCFSQSEDGTARLISTVSLFGKVHEANMLDSYSQSIRARWPHKILWRSYTKLVNNSLDLHLCWSYCFGGLDTFVFVTFCNIGKQRYLMVFPLFTLKSDTDPPSDENHKEIIWIRLCGNRFNWRKEMFYLTTHSAHYLWLYDVKHMVKDYRDNEIRHLLPPPHGLHFPISGKTCFIYTIS